MKFVLRVIINAVAIWLATVLISGLDVVAEGDTAAKVLVFLGVALVFGLVNAIVKPIVQVLALPIYILTLGLFTLVVNALLLMLTAWITEQTSYGLRVEDFWSAVLGALLISVVSFVLSTLTRSRS